MYRTITALVLGTTLAGSALPALAGPNGTSVAPFFPLDQQRREPARQAEPHGLLGDLGESSDVRTIPPAVNGKQPARGWLRRPSEGK